MAIKFEFAEASNYADVATACMNKFDNAIALFQSAMKIDPQYSKATANLKMVLENRDKICHVK